MGELGNIIRDKMIRAFEPEVAINLIDIGKSKTAKVVLQKIYTLLEDHYVLVSDEENNVIYLKRRKEKT